MTVLSLQDISRQLDHVLIAEWALARIENMQEVNAADADAWIQQLFHETSLRRILKSSDPTILTRVFRILPERCFEPHADFMLQNWSGWHGSSAGWSAPILARFRPDKAATLFTEWLQKDNALQNFDKLFGVLKAIKVLPPEQAKGLVEWIHDSFLQSDQADVSDFFMSEILGCYLKLGLPLPALTIQTLTRADSEATQRLLSSVYTALIGDSLYDDLAWRIDSGNEALVLNVFRSNAEAFKKEAPLAELDACLSKHDEQAYRDVAQLLEQAAMESDAAKWALEIVTACHQKNTSSANRLVGIYFMVAVVGSCWFKGDTELEGLAYDDCLRLLAVDLFLPYEQQLDHLMRGYHVESLSQDLMNLLESGMDSVAAIRAARLMGLFAQEVFIPLLVQCLETDQGDLLCESAKIALARLGKPAAEYITAHYDTFDSSQEIYSLGVLKEANCEAAVQFMIQKAETLMDEDSGYLSALSSIADERFIALLEPELKRQHPEIDDAFYTLCTLHHYPHDELAQIEMRLLHQRRKMMQRLQSGALFDFDDHTLTLELCCQSCGKKNLYDVEHVFISGRGDEIAPPLIGQDICCVSCDHWSEFELAGNGLMAVTAEMMKMSAVLEEGREYVGPLELASAQLQQSDQVQTISSSIEACINDTKVHPDRAESWLALGNTYRSIYRPRKASECFKTAVELEPGCVEGAFQLAEIVALQGNPESAFWYLASALQHKELWHFYRLLHITPRIFATSFAKLYNQLRLESGYHHLPALHPEFYGSIAKKVGRNDCCPCGSGKKYKRCCLRKRVS